MTIPDSHLSWENSYDYAFDSLALFDNDKEQGEPVEVCELFVQKISDVARVESKLYHIGGGSNIRIEMKNLNAFPGAPARADPAANPAKTSQVIDRVCLTLVYNTIAVLEERGVTVLD